MPVVAIIGTAITVPATIILFVLTVIMKKREKGCTQKVQAVVVDPEAYYHDCLFYPSLSYVTQNGEEFIVQSRIGYSKPKPAGFKRTLYYDPKNPSRWVLSRKSDIVYALAIIMFCLAGNFSVFVIFTLAGVFVW